MLREIPVGEEVSFLVLYNPTGELAGTLYRGQLTSGCELSSVRSISGCGYLD